MNSITRYILVLLLVALPLSMVYAQQTNGDTNGTRNIVDELNTARSGEGHVTIYEDEAIKGLAGKQYEVQRTVYSSASSGIQYVKMRGYKIQVFSGNDQRRSKNEAYYKQNLVNSAFPEHETVVLFNAPFWRLRAGNFKTREDAAEVLKEMRKAFPNFGREMYIVVDEVKIPI